MKFYSETLNRLFDSQEACVQAENEHTKQLEEKAAKEKALANKRAERAKIVEDLHQTAVEAKQAYDKALQEFLKDYGSFHTTLKTTDPFFGFFDWF